MIRQGERSGPAQDSRDEADGETPISALSALVLAGDTDEGISAAITSAGLRSDRVSTVGDLAGARQVLAETVVDAVFVDLASLGLAGLETIPVLAAAAPNALLVIVAEEHDGPTVYQAIALGADDQISIAVDNRALVEVLNRAASQKTRPTAFRSLEAPDRLLDAVEDPAVVLDGSGRTIAANAAWLDSAAIRGADRSSVGVGVNYLTICDRAADPDTPGATIAADGIRSVLLGQTDRFVLDYPCGDDVGESWFTMTVRPLGKGGGAVVTHHDVTALKLAERNLQSGTEWAHQLLEQASPIFVLVDESGTVIHVSDSTTDSLGIDAALAVGQHVFERIDPAEHDHAREVLGRVAATPDGAEHCRIHVLDRKGSRHELDLQVRNYLSNPLIAAITIAGSDVTEARRYQIARHLESRLLRQLPAAVIVTDERAVVAYWNDEAARLFGRPADEVLGRAVAELDLGAAGQSSVASMMAQALEGTRWEGEFEAVHPNGMTTTANLSVEHISVREIDFSGLVAVCLDVSDRKELEAGIEYLEMHDTLTGLPNRRLFIDHLQLAISRDARLNRNTAVLYVDLDNFAELNEDIGDAAGDEALRTVGELLQAATRRGDLVARMGGDEFAICCENLKDAAEALTVAERISEALSTPFSCGGREVVAPVSIGIAVAAPGSQAENLLRHADGATSTAKERGGSSIEFFDDETHARARRRHELAGALRTAIAAGAVDVHYQPLVRISTGEMVGFEALARWTSDTQGPIPPEEFVSVAESSGLIRELGGLVLREACAEWGEWNALRPGHALSIAVNVSALQLSDASLVEEVGTALSASGMPAELLCLEVTESALDNAEQVLPTLLTLRSMGVKLAIDDFGTGYSSLSRLTRFPLDYLKIDRSFVAGMIDRAEDAAVVQAVLHLAEDLGLSKIAEGVENRGQLAVLRAEGCEFGQGYLWSRPLPATEARLAVTKGLPAIS